MAGAADRRKPPGSGGRKIRACDHHLRRRILRLLHLSSPLSPSEMSRVLEEPIGRVGYHLRLLEALGTAKLVRERQVRGTIEHFYTSLVEKDTLVRSMLKATKQEDESL